MQRRNGDHGEKRARGEVRFDARIPQQQLAQRPARSSSDEEEDDDQQDIGGEPVVKENLRYLMKRPSYGDILQGLQGGDQQQMSEGMSAILAAAARQQQEAAVAAAVMANQQPNLQMQVMAQVAGGPQFFPVPYHPSGPVMLQAPSMQPPPPPHPSSRQHTKHDEQEMVKKERRLLKNREAAKECRRKKKEFVKSMEDRIRGLEQHNMALQMEVAKLRQRLGLPDAPPMEPAYVAPPMLNDSMMGDKYSSGSSGNEDDAH
eukprot:m.233746 g.233746  ORF g.233746 m.233746 type:complete len:260 (-) comp12560_c0_seq1:155-934(-)